jgi:N-acylneuraminate cytidylyltransferase
MIIAFIPARGGSKRLPRKNLKLLGGRPLIFYSIAVARAVERIDRCVVSTEDAEIACVAQEYGAEVIHRPLHLADDHASTASVAQHALGELVRQGARPEALVTLQPNCPLRPAAMVEEALDLFQASEAADSLITVTENRHKLGEIAGSLFRPRYQPGTRSQDMARSYYENGLVYISRARMVLEQGEIFGERIVPLITDPLYAMGDIDDALDFEVAEFLFHRYQDRFDYIGR